MSELVRTITDLYRLHLPLGLVKGLADRDTGPRRKGGHYDINTFRFHTDLDYDEIKSLLDNRKV